MSIEHDADRRFHENLQEVGRQVAIPAGPSEEVRARASASFRSATRPHRVWRWKPFSSHAAWSSLGLAACLALVVGLLFLWNGGPSVQASTILARLNEQMAESQLIEVTMDSIAFDEVSLEGRLQVAEGGVAGDLYVLVTEDETPIEIDMAIGMSAGGGWVLIRQLQIADPEAQAILGFLFPPGVETLLVLPSDTEMDAVGEDIGGALQGLGSAKVLEAFQELVENQEEMGATITYQADGTVLMTLPLRDTEALEALERLVEGDEDVVEGDEGAEAAEVVIDLDVADEDNELIGSTLNIVYDPDAELVRSFAITDFGDEQGTISVAIRDGEIDPDLLDSARVTTPNTRTLDLDGLQSFFKQFDTTEEPQD